MLRAEEERVSQLKKEEQKREAEKLALEHFQRLDADKVKKLDCLANKPNFFPKHNDFFLHCGIDKKYSQIFEIINCKMFFFSKYRERLKSELVQILDR